MQSDQKNLSSDEINRLKNDPRNRFCSFTHDKEREPWDMREVLPMVERVHAEHVKFRGEQPDASQQMVRSHLEQNEPRLAQFNADHPKIASMLTDSRIVSEERMFPLLKFMISSHLKMQDGLQTEEETQREFMVKAIPQLLQPEPESEPEPEPESEPAIVEITGPELD